LGLQAAVKRLESPSLQGGDRLLLFERCHIGMSLTRIAAFKFVRGGAIIRICRHDGIVKAWPGPQASWSLFCAVKGRQDVLPEGKN
jgi:hypothetical protein